MRRTFLHVRLSLQNNQRALNYTSDQPLLDWCTRVMQTKTLKYKFGINLDALKQQRTKLFKLVAINE